MLLCLKHRGPAQLYNKTKGRPCVTNLVVPDQALLQEGRSLVEIIPRQISRDRRRAVMLITIWLEECEHE
jgi:hypothetical protein